MTVVVEIFCGGDLQSGRENVKFVVYIGVVSEGNEERVAVFNVRVIGFGSLSVGLDRVRRIRG